MTSPHPELPNDISSCHALIKQLHAELQVARERIEEMASVGLQDAATRLAHLEVVQSLRRHRELILNWFQAQGAISAGIVEGLNNKTKLTTRKSYGFRTYETIEAALYHNLGALPEPELTHKFW